MSDSAPILPQMCMDGGWGIRGFRELPAFPRQPSVLMPTQIGKLPRHRLKMVCLDANPVPEINLGTSFHCDLLLSQVYSVMVAAHTVTVTAHTTWCIAEWRPQGVCSCRIVLWICGNVYIYVIWTPGKLPFAVIPAFGRFFVFYLTAAIHINGIT